jgi:alkylation response protein AidB-like acyl-CoA dehydrogenase
MLQDHHRLIVEAVDDFVADQVAPLAAAIDGDDRLPRDVLSALGASGYLGGLLPEPYGEGSDLLSFVLLVERLAAVSPSLAWAVVVHTSATMAIASSATDEQKSRLLPQLAGGERLASLAFTEADAGADFFAVECTARAVAGGYAVSGSKTFISLARDADAFVTLVRTERDGEMSGPSMLLIEREHPGFETGSSLRGMGMRGIGWGELVLDECSVPSANLLGEETKGTRVVYGMAGPYLLGAAALALGIASGAYQCALGHLRDRQVKGKAIGDHEALQFRVAELSATVEAARSLVYRASLDDNPRSFLPFQAKLFASEAALDLVRAAVQLTGATGYVEGSLVERLARDAFAVTLHFENNDFLRGFVGRTLVQS